MISAIVPARNEEATIARTVESLAAQPEIGEIIVVNDQSSDATGAILAELTQRLPKLRALHGAAPPPHWTGKNFAAATGARVARGEWLLFTDADTLHLAGSAGRALADAARHGADLVSYSPEQETRTFWEKALVPFVYWRLSQRYTYDCVNDPKLPDAAANGQYILIRRDAYNSLGGHAAVAAELLEDVALAKRAKAAGHRIFFSSGHGIVQTRMYDSFRAVWEGWTKNCCPLFGRTPGEVLVEIDAATPWLGTVLAGLIVLERAMRSPVDGLLALVALIFFVRPWAWYEGWLRRNRYPAGYIRYYLPGAALYTAVLLASWWKHSYGSAVWKGREYATRV